MTILYFWLVCGFIGFCLALILTWLHGSDLTTEDIIEFLVCLVLLGPVGLTVVVVVGCLTFTSATTIADRVIIRGRKR